MNKERIRIKYIGAKRILAYGDQGQYFISRLPSVPVAGEPVDGTELKVDGIFVQAATAFQSKNRKFDRFGRVCVVILGIHHAYEVGKPEKYDVKLILYRPVESATLTGDEKNAGGIQRDADEHSGDEGDYVEMVDNVVSVFNVANSVDMMFLTGNRMEFMDTSGIVWRLQFDSIEGQDAILHLYQRFNGQIKVIPSEQDYYYMFGLCASDQRNLNKDKRDLQVERRLAKLERIATQMARAFTNGGAGGGAGGSNGKGQNCHQSQETLLSDNDN